VSDDTELSIQRKARQTEGLGLWTIEAGDVFVPPNESMYRDIPTSHPDSVAGQSQAGLILKHLQSGGTLTALDALDLFGCNRLAARVADLRGKGYNVKSRWLVTPSGKRVSEYYLTSTNG
jgi:hypothetical protein